MNYRRNFIKKSLLATGALTSGLHTLFGSASSDLKITKVYHYKPPKYLKPTFNQAREIVVIETNNGLTGIGEGGSTEMIKQCAGILIGEDPFRIDYLWQKMYRGYFYPAGREKLHALGALDIALWDLRAKAFDAPLHQLIGGLSRNHIQCYSTGFPSQGSIKETARACIESGFYAFRTAPDFGEEGIFDAHKIVEKTYELCHEVQEGVGEGKWMIDLHTRLDTEEAIAVCNRIESLYPLFVEDLVRSENPEVYELLRQKVNIPIAIGEQFGDRWDFNTLIEKHFMDYSRVTIPNCGGITEFLKICSLCETHYVSLAPHFTGPISLAVLSHTLSTYPGFVVMEITGDGPEKIDYLNSDYVNFKNGKIFPGDRPGIGVELNTNKVDLINIISKPGPKHPMYHRPDGSLTNW